MPATPITQDQLLAVADRVLDPSYLDAIKNVGPGYEILQAGAAMFARISQAIANFDDGSYFTSARGGAFATAEVTFTRTTTTGGAFTLLAGSVVKASRGGQHYFVQEDVVFGALTTAVDGSVIAVAQGWEWNVPGVAVTARGETLPGDIDTIVLPLMEPPFAETGLRVAQAGAALGGRGAMIDALAADRGLTRLANESDDALAVRAREVPDVVSPPAIIRQLDRFLGALGIAYERIRWWELRFQSCWDAPVDASPPQYPGAEVVGFWDDPRDLSFPGGWRNRWDAHEVRGAVVVVVDNIAAISDHGGVWDDPGATLADHSTSRGRYAFGAWDMPPEGVGAIDSLRPSWDGPDVGQATILGQLYQLLDDITGGVPFVIELGGQ